MRNRKAKPEVGPGPEPRRRAATRQREMPHEAVVKQVLEDQP